MHTADTKIHYVGNYVSIRRYIYYTTIRCSLLFIYHINAPYRRKKSEQKKICVSYNFITFGVIDMKRKKEKKKEDK